MVFSVKLIFNKGISLRKSLLYTVFLLALGGSAGWLASKTLMPLPWMIGSLLICALWSINFGTKIILENYTFPQKFRNYFVAIIGVMIGLQVTADLILQISDYLPSLLGLIVFSWCAHFLNYKILTKLGKYDRATAFFSSAPGGLMESIAMSEEYGGEIKIVTLQQFLRIILVIILVPIIISIWFGAPVGSAAGITIKENASITLTDLIYIFFLVIVGLSLGSRLRIPAGHLFGPMLLTVFVTLGTDANIQLPNILILVAQVVIGTSLGARFYGIDTNILFIAVRLSALSVVTMLIMAFIFVLVLQSLSDLSVVTLFISFAPGGVTEMSLIALTIASSPALVSAHHIFRIVVTVSLLGFIYKKCIEKVH